MTDESISANGLFNIKKLKNPNNRLENIRHIRKLTQTSYQGKQLCVCRILGRFLMYVSTRDERHGIQLQMNGYWEMNITEVIAQHLKPKMNVLDVGANYGYFSFLMASLVGHNGHVYAIEANPFIYKLMKKSIKVNGFKNRVTVINKAITDHDAGLQPFIFSKQSPMNGSLKENKNAEAQIRCQESVDIETTSLDILFDSTTIDLMKIDIEGSEDKLWFGSEQLRKRNPNMIIIMEFNRFRYQNVLGFINSIFEQGYSVHMINGKSMQKLNEHDLTTYKIDHHIMLLLSKNQQPQTNDL